MTDDLVANNGGATSVVCYIDGLRFDSGQWSGIINGKASAYVGMKKNNH